MEIVYCVDNKMGGITSFNYNIVNNITGDHTNQVVIHIDQVEWTYTRADIRFRAAKELYFNFSAKDNLYAVISRLHNLLPRGAGAMVLNDCLEMQMLDHYPVEKTTYQVVHDEYNFGLAERYAHVVDVFIAHSRFFYDKLLAALPQRAGTIFFLPHGVNIPTAYRVSHEPDQPLKLLFLGRMAKKKGVYDLPVIDKYLNEWGVPHAWTCVGNGPELKTLQETWQPANGIVQFLSPATNEEVMAVCAARDVFVLPTRFEGSPVSLLETMSAGLVPVITDLPGGIREIVQPGIGYRIGMGDAAGFATAIRQLSENRAQLSAYSSACREKITRDFNIQHTAATYQQLFARYKEFYKPKQLKKIKIGSRLDQPWIPAAVTHTLRNL